MKNIKDEIFFWSSILLLIGSSFFVGYNVNENITITQKNDVFNNHERDINDYFFGFSDDVIYDLNKFYNESGKNEFRVCLKGDIINDWVYIDNYSKFLVGDNDSVSWDECNGEGELGLLHSHPNHVSNPSHADLHFSFRNYREENNTISAIMYDHNLINMFTEKYWKHGEKLDFSLKDKKD